MIRLFTKIRGINRNTNPIRIGRPTKTSITKVDNIKIEISMYLIFFSLRIVKKAIFINDKMIMSFNSTFKFP